MGPYFGKLVDKWGYPLIVTACTGLMVLTGFAWVSRPENTWLFILFVLLVYNGNGGFLAGMLRQSECIASVRLPKREYAEFSVGLGALLFAVGTFTGCAFAGRLYTGLGGSLEQYFRWCVWGPAVMCILSAVWLLTARRNTVKE